MIDDAALSKIQTEYASLKREYSTVSRKYSRLEREHENLTHLYKQAVALRDYNEKEKEAQMLYNQMLRDNCPDDMFLLDTDIRILLCTSSIKAYFNGEAPQTEGRDFLELLNEVFEDAFILRMKTAVLDVISSNSPSNFSVDVSKRSGETVYFTISIAPVLGPQGELTGMVVLLHDTSELRIANIKAEQASRAKSDFLSRMSHEMRTPMNAIIGMTNIAKNTKDPDKKEYCLDKIEGASKHLLGVINDILDMSKIEANKFELSYHDFEFEKMLMHVINVVNFYTEEKHQNLIINLDKDVPQSIIGDELRLRQVITNLLTNAAKFTPEGGTVILSVKRLPDREGEPSLQIEVADNGIGISAEQQSRLFNSFEQAEGGTARKYGGTGLGLAISKRIVELMGGSMWIKSELGKGARFIFTMKFKMGAAKSRPRIRINKENFRILAVDDSPETREYFLHVFAELKVKCDVAADAFEALDIISRSDKPYNIFFVDWQMPGMDGIELTRRIKEITSDNAVIIMISVAEWSDIEKEAIAAGVDSFISKPLFPSVLINTINQCLGQDAAATDVPHNTASLGVQDYKGHTLLIAEDVDINREIMAAILEDTGASIDFAENGVEAVKSFIGHPGKYSLILMDIHMPEMDGYEATRKIRSFTSAEAKTIPIVAMTANVFREDIERCIEAGMNDHLGKPVDTEDLFSKLGKYLLPKPPTHPEQ